MRFELHCHTNHSHCSNLTPRLILETSKKRKLDGVCITDHDTFQGAIQVEKANKDKNFMVVKGTEFSTPAGHLIGLFLRQQIKYSPKQHSLKWLVDQIHKQKGLIILAHPGTIVRFSDFSIEEYKKLDIDAVEGYNARNVFAIENSYSIKIAQQLGKPIVAGSDAHFTWEIGRNTVECDDLYSAIKTNKLKLHVQNPLVSLTTVYSHAASLLNKLIE